MIIGAGGLGLMCLALHKAMGGHAAIVVDIDPAKREAARRGGARAVIDGNAPDAAQQIIDATNGGVWAVIDLVGSTATAPGSGSTASSRAASSSWSGSTAARSRCRCRCCRCVRITLQGSYVGSLTELAELLELVRRTGLPPLPVAPVRSPR